MTTTSDARKEGEVEWERTKEIASRAKAFAAANRVGLESIAMHCARFVRGCTTDEQYSELVDRIVEALSFASATPSPDAASTRNAALEGPSRALVEVFEDAIAIEITTDGGRKWLLGTSEIDLVFRVLKSHAAPASALASHSPKKR